MSYRKRRAGDKPGFGISRETLLLCGIFLIGGVFGSFFASGFELDTENLFSNYGSAVGLIMSPPFKLFFFYHAILLAIIFLSVFMKWGMLFIAGALAIKGFSLSIAITCYIKVFGLKGYIPALLSLFPAAFCIMAVLLIMSSHATRHIKNSPFPGRGIPFFKIRSDNTYFFSAAFCLTVIFIAGLVHCYIISLLTSALINAIS